MRDLVGLGRVRIPPHAGFCHHVDPVVSHTYNWVEFVFDPRSTCTRKFVQVRSLRTSVLLLPSGRRMGWDVEEWAGMGRSMDVRSERVWEEGWVYNTM